MEIGFSLGSNLGDRAAHLARARRMLEDTADARILAASALYETEPVNVSEAYRHLKFINAVLIIESAFDAPYWLEAGSGIEYTMGRVRGEDKNAPRPIDIDILYAGDRCIDSGGLMVPHPRWAQRRFVVQPLADVRPGLILPGQSLTVADILQTLDPSEQLEKLDTAW